MEGREKKARDVYARVLSHLVAELEWDAWDAWVRLCPEARERWMDMMDVFSRRDSRTEGGRALWWGITWHPTMERWLSRGPREWAAWEAGAIEAMR